MVNRFLENLCTPVLSRLNIAHIITPSFLNTCVNIIFVPVHKSPIWFPFKLLRLYCVSPTCPTCLAQFILLCMIIWIFGEEYSSDTPKVDKNKHSLLQATTHIWPYHLHIECTSVYPRGQTQILLTERWMPEFWICLQLQHLQIRT
jgi:hypothetical protein